LIIHVEDRAFNDKRYAVSAKKLQALGWKTQVSWEHGLKATVDWYSKNWSNWDTKDITKALEPHPKETEYSLRFFSFILNKFNNNNFTVIHKLI